MTQYKSYHYAKGSNNTHYHYYADSFSRYGNIDPPPSPHRAHRSWNRTPQRAADALSLSSDEGLTPPNPDRAQRRWTRRLERAANALSLSSDDWLSATPSDAAERLNINLEERMPRVYQYRGSELANPASTLRHASIPAGVRLRDGGRDEEPPWWFARAGSRATRRFGADWAAWEADRSMKEDLGFEEREATRARRTRMSKRRDSSPSSDAVSRSEVFELYKRLFNMYAAAQKEKKSKDEQVRTETVAAMLEQIRKAAMGQQCEDPTEAMSTPDWEDWIQWQKSEAQRRAAFKRMGKAPEWERSKTRQQADFEQWQKKIRERIQQKEFIRLRDKEKAFVKRSKTKRAPGLPSILKMEVGEESTARIARRMSVLAR